MSAEDFEDIKQHAKEKFASDRKRFMSDATSKDDGCWTKHTEYHWSRYVNDFRLDYWPSRKKYQFRGKVQRGDVYKFIKKQTDRR